MELLMRNREVVLTKETLLLRIWGYESDAEDNNVEVYISVLRHLRAAGNAIPVLLLTARSDVSDRVEGLDCGADYYLTKPFEMSELLACVRALTRRQGEVVMDELSFGDLKLNLSTCDLSWGDKKVRLGKKEFSLMHILMSNGEAVVSKDTLINKVWGFESDAEDNNVEVYISFLRKKLAFLKAPVQIATLRKFGYRLERTDT
ncbi:MAG: winged helix-turn-helix domain-containing protein [Clostridia bacterium]|nr:winged helix-turn-helix domain-containing protein [Clostridia bacterium]